MSLLDSAPGELLPGPILALLEAGGPVLLAILGLSVAGWSFALWAWLELRGERGGLATRGFLAELHGAIRRGDIAGARQRCRARGGPLARVLLAALELGALETAALENAEANPETESSSPDEDRIGIGQERLERTAGAELRRMRAGLPPVAVAAAVLPLLGLLGTVLGMIATFEALVGRGADASGLADGISQALVTTQAGLAGGLPLLLLHARLSRVIDAVGREIRLEGRAVLRLLREPAAEGAPA